MAIETQPGSTQAPGGGEPGSTPKVRNYWLRPGIHTAIILGYSFLVLGWLIGLGVFNDLIRMMLGKPLSANGHSANGGIAKYFRYTLDHKVVGLQYLIGMLVYFFT